MMNYFFRDNVEGVNTIDINGNYKPVIKGDILVLSNGTLGKVLGVSRDYGYYGMAMFFFPCGYAGNSNACSYPHSLQHTVILPSARIIKAKYNNPNLGVKIGDYLIAYQQWYLTKLPVSGCNDELLHQVQDFFTKLGNKQSVRAS